MVSHIPPRHVATATLWLTLALLTLPILLPGSRVLAQGDVSGQQAVIEIVRLQHRDPTQIRAAITPYLDERGAINQIDNNLIISTSRANLVRLEELITELDVPLRQLRISVDFRYGRPPVPVATVTPTVTPTLTPATGLVDDATIATTPEIRPPENTVQTLVVTEGEFAHFDLASGNPVGGLRFTEVAELLEQQSSGGAQTLGLTAHPRDTGAVIELATLQREPDLNGNLQARVVSRTVDVSLNQWQVLTPQPDSIAVRVEVLP